MLNQIKYAILWLSAVLAVQGTAQIEISANNQTGCIPLPVLIEVTSPANISSYFWEITLPDNSVVTAASDSYFSNLSMPGSYDITLTINGSTTQTWENYITVYDIPVVDFTVNMTTGCYPLCVEFTDNSIATDGAIVAWNWDFGDGNSSTDIGPIHTYEHYGEYTVTQYVATQFGCLDSISANLEIEQDIGIWVPNAFTPNNDGVNEMFQPIFYGFNITDYSLKIYDNWGVIIFETLDPNRSWKGNYQPKLHANSTGEGVVKGGEYYVKDGVYNWQITFRKQGDSETHFKRGIVTVIR